MFHGFDFVADWERNKSLGRWLRKLEKPSEKSTDQLEKIFEKNITLKCLIDCVAKFFELQVVT